MIRPYKNLILVEPQDNTKEKKAGILLPDYAENVMPDRGKVVAIGSEVKDIKKGDMVLFDRVRADNYRDKTGLIEGKYMLIKEELILAVIK